MELVFIERDVHPGLGIPGATLVTNGRGGQVSADTVHTCMMQRMYLQVQMRCGSCAHEQVCTQRSFTTSGSGFPSGCGQYCQRSILILKRRPGRSALKARSHWCCPPPAHDIHKGKRAWWCGVSTRSSPPLEAAICLCSTPVACGMRTNEGMSGEVPDVVGGWGQEREMGSEEEGKRREWEGVRTRRDVRHAAWGMRHETCWHPDAMLTRPLYLSSDAAVVSVLFAAARWRSKCRCSLSSV